MRRTTRCFPILAVAGLVACSDSAGPLEPAGSGLLRADVAGASGCYTVEFNVLAVPSGAPFVFTGQISGDLEGTVSIHFNPATFKAAGVTVANSGTAQWTITGGTVAGLTSFSTAFDNRSFSAVVRPGSPATVGEAIGKHRALSGVQQANLSYTGVLNSLPFFHADLDYHGVICP